MQDHKLMCSEPQDPLDRPRPDEPLTSDDAESHVVLGMHILYDEDEEVDFLRAARYFHRAAILGNAVGQYLVSGAYATGNGMNKDSNLALFWLRQSAEQNYIMAQLLLAQYHYFGWFSQKNDDTARCWLERACKLGSVDAEHALQVVNGLYADRKPTILDRQDMVEFGFGNYSKYIFSLNMPSHPIASLIRERNYQDALRRMCEDERAEDADECSGEYESE